MIKYFILLLILVSVKSNAQRVVGQVALVHYALDAFEDAKVKLKSGQVYAQRMNYNLLTKEMIFEQNGKYLAVAAPQDIDTVSFATRTFIPADKGFKEYVAGTYPLIIEYTATIREKGAPTGYGTTTNTAATTSYSAMLATGGAYELKLPDEFSVQAGRNYFIKKDGKQQKFNNESQLVKIIPEKKELINTIVSYNHTNFSKPSEVAALVKQLQ